MTNEAGNKSEVEVKFEVATNINALIANVNHYADLNLIYNHSAERYLEFGLKRIKRTFQPIRD